MLFIEMGKNFMAAILVYANYRDCQIGITGGHIEIMLILDVAKLELTGGHIEIMLVIARSCVVSLVVSGASCLLVHSIKLCAASLARSMTTI